MEGLENFNQGGGGSTRGLVVWGLGLFEDGGDRQVAQIFVETKLDSIKIFL